KRAEVVRRSAWTRNRSVSVKVPDLIAQLQLGVLREVVSRTKCNVMLGRVDGAVPKAGNSRVISLKRPINAFPIQCGLEVLRYVPPQSRKDTADVVVSAQAA